jgi:hypothetical protein
LALVIKRRSDCRMTGQRHSRNQREHRGPVVSALRPQE